MPRSPRRARRWSTTTTLVSSANPAVAGQPVTFTAHVSVGVPGVPTPTGMIRFFDGPTQLGTAVLDLGGTASFTTSTLIPGLHAITAQFGGDANAGASTSAPLSETVAKADTTTAITSSGSPAIFGQPVTFTATVSPVAPGAGTPTGSVSFLHGPLLLGPVVLNALGQASFTTNTLPVGNNPIAAVYVGDARENSSTSALLTQTIVPAASSTAVTAAPNVSTFGRVVTLTATVKTLAPSSGTPTGSVTFTVDGNPVGAAHLNPTGQATLTTSALAAGSHTITALYGGNPNVLASASNPLPLMVAKTATTTTLTSSPSAIVTGQPLTLTATVGLVAPSTGAPTGSVTFRDGTAVLGMVSLTPNGAVATASLVTTALQPGAHSLTAAFSGDANTNASTSPARAQVATKASTTITLTTSTSAAVVGQSVTFTATLGVVAPGTGTPKGSVMFLNGAVALGTVIPDDAGVASLPTSALTLGPHAITARYVGDKSFAAVTSSPLTVTILKASTVTTVTGSVNPAAWHQPVTLTAAVSVVAPGGGTPTGLVTFFNGPTSLGTGALNATGRATLTTSTLTVGDHAITASYAGAATFNGSVSTVFTETVTRAASATALTATPNPAVTGRPVVFTATVSVVAPGSGTPTGAVTFLDGPTPLITVPLNAARQATLTTSTLAVGDHAITASYAGDASIAPSTSSVVTETIAKPATTTALTSSANPSVAGRPVTLTAKVTAVAPASGTPTGLVIFWDGATVLGTATLDATRRATVTTSSLTVGAHALLAVYGGDAGFATSTSPTLTETIGKAATKTVLSTSVTPIVHGPPVTFTAAVTVVAPGTGSPTGSVSFLDGATLLGVAPLDGSGHAAFTTSTLIAGAHAITARYGGDGSFTASTSAALTETVTKASTATALATSVTATVVGQPVALTAVVSVNPPGAGTPTGGVMFLNGAAVLGTGTLTAGQAVFTTSSLTLGAHTITARYVGDPSFATSTSSALTVTVATAATTTSVSAPASAAAHHQPVTLTAAVAVVSPGSGAPMGTVTFFNGPASLGTGALNAMGRATLTTSALTLGDHDITASYGGSATFNGSVSTVFTERVTRANSATALTATPNPAVVGRPVVLTATVSLVIPGVPAPTGTVTFFDGPTELDTRPLSPAHQAVLTTSGLAVGAHAVRAVYNGDSSVATSQSNAVTATINKGTTTTTLTSSANPASVGQTVTFTATVNVVAPAAGLPTGTVTFMEGLTPLGTAPLSATRQATLTIGGFALGVALADRDLRRRCELRHQQLDTADRKDHQPAARHHQRQHRHVRTGAGRADVHRDHDRHSHEYDQPHRAAARRRDLHRQPHTGRRVHAGWWQWNDHLVGVRPAGREGDRCRQWSVTGTPTATGTFAVTITATDAGGCPGSRQPSVTVAPVVSGLTYNGLVDNTQFVVTGGTTVSPTTPFVGGTVRLGGNALPSAGVKVTAGTVSTS